MYEGTCGHNLEKERKITIENLINPTFPFAAESSQIHVGINCPVTFFPFGPTSKIWREKSHTDDETLLKSIFRVFDWLLLARENSKQPIGENTRVSGQISTLFPEKERGEWVLIWSNFVWRNR